MKADIEEQKNDAKLGEQVNRSSSRKKLARTADTTMPRKR
jgi:hypothetical protein